MNMQLRIDNGTGTYSNPQGQEGKKKSTRGRPQGAKNVDPNGSSRRGGRQSQKKKCDAETEGKKAKRSKGDGRYVSSKLNVMVSNMYDVTHCGSELMSTTPCLSLQDSTERVNADQQSATLDDMMASNDRPHMMTAAPMMTTMATIAQNSGVPTFTTAFGTGMPHVRTTD